MKAAQGEAGVVERGPLSAHTLQRPTPLLLSLFLHLRPAVSVHFLPPPCPPPAAPTSPPAALTSPRWLLDSTALSTLTSPM